jgi:hypothetical protein
MRFTLRSPDTTERVTAALPARVRTPLLVGGDALCFVIFAALGLRSHGEPQGIGTVLWTAFPFALAWFIVAPFLGAYRQRAISRGPARALATAEVAWIGSYPVALLARWAFSADHQIPISFAVVILLTNAIFLGGWRTLFAFISSRIARRG